MTIRDPNSYDFATMTADEALEALVALDVERWGPGEAEASRRLHRSRSRGLRINAIVHHVLYGYGDAFSPAAKAAAKAALTDDDHDFLRRGG